MQTWRQAQAQYQHYQMISEGDRTMTTTHYTVRQSKSGFFVLLAHLANGKKQKVSESFNESYIRSECDRLTKYNDWLNGYNAQKEEAAR